MNRKIVPVLLSFLLSGLGQIYKREYSKGGSLALLEMTSILLISSRQPTLYELGILGFPIIWVLGMLDAADLLSSEYLLAGDRWKWLIIGGGGFLAIALATGLFAGTMWRFRPLSSQRIPPPEEEMIAPTTPEPHPVEERSDERYIISLGVFRNKDNAIRYTLRLNEMGYPVELRPIGNRWMVLMVGFSTIDEARTKALELNRSGLDCYVAETNRPRFPVFIPQKGR